MKRGNLIPIEFVNIEHKLSDTVISNRHFFKKQVQSVFGRLCRLLDLKRFLTHSCCIENMHFFVIMNFFRFVFAPLRILRDEHGDRRKLWRLPDARRRRKTEEDSRRQASLDAKSPLSFVCYLICFYLHVHNVVFFCMATNVARWGATIFFY